jgi:hypothetical protein
MIGVVAFGLAACGSEYVDAFNPAMDTFNAAAQGINAQIEQLNQDNTLLGDPTWQDETIAAMEVFEESGKALAALPEAPEELAEVDSLVQEMAFETNLFVNAYYDMIENQDISQIDEANSHMDNINSLIGQTNDAITAAE